MRSRSHPETTPPPAARRRLALGAAVTAVAIGATALVAPAAHAADPVTINLVTINDFHGRLENESASAAAGIASLATAVNQVRAANPNTVFAAAGDLIGASTFTSFVQQDAPTIEGLNAAGLDVSSVGNHEFDQGWADLRDRVQPLADWEYLAANLFDRATGQPILPEYYTQTFDGVTIGFVGAVTNELPSLVSPAGIADVVVGDVADNVNRVADDLRDGDAANGEADIVVLLVHEGAATTAVSSATDPSTPFGRIVTQVDGDVDAIVSGHTHLAYNHVIDGRPVISSGQYGEKFSNMTITYDADDPASLQMTNVIVDMKGPGPAFTPNFAQDQTILETIVQPAQAFANERGAVALGDITADFSRALQPGVDAQGNPALVENRGGESTLGNWVADVQLWGGQQDRPQTQIAFMNPGGLRANLTFAPDGVVTYREAAQVQPFANSLVTFDLTGAAIKQVLEQQWQPATASRPFLKLGISKGFEYTFDPAAPAGSRVTGMWLNDIPIAEGDTYAVVTNSFLASGGDNFGAFNQGTGKAEWGRSDLETVVEWFEVFETATPDLAQRSIGVTMSPPATAGGYAVGSVIDLSLSSLDFTASEPPAGTVDVAIGGVPVGSAAVTRTLTTANDLTGQASLQVTVPEGVSGTVPLTITTPTGTDFDIPITVFERADSSTFGWPGTFLARRGATIPYTVLVLADGVAPTGEVTVYDGSQPIATATLTEADNGRVTVQLTGLGRGLHRLSAEYAGSGTVQPSSSRWLPVLIL